MMKIVLFLFAFVLSLNAVELGWSHEYEKGLQEAKKEHKLVYVLITSENCGWCRKFERTTLQNKEIKQRLKKEFVTIHFSREWDDVPAVFKTSPVPRHYFVDAKGEILYSSLGYRDVEMFESFMDNAQEKYQLNKEKK